MWTIRPDQEAKFENKSLNKASYNMASQPEKYFETTTYLTSILVLDIHKTIFTMYHWVWHLRLKFGLQKLHVLRVFHVYKAVWTPQW